MKPILNFLNFFSISNQLFQNILDLILSSSFNSLNLQLFFLSLKIILTHLHTCIFTTSPFLIRKLSNVSINEYNTVINTLKIRSLGHVVLTTEPRLKYRIPRRRCHNFLSIRFSGRLISTHIGVASVIVIFHAVTIIFHFNTYLITIIYKTHLSLDKFQHGRALTCDVGVCLCRVVCTHSWTCLIY